FLCVRRVGDPDDPDIRVVRSELDAEGLGVHILVHGWFVVMVALRGCDTKLRGYGVAGLLDDCDLTHGCRYYRSLFRWPEDDDHRNHDHREAELHGPHRPTAALDALHHGVPHFGVVAIGERRLAGHRFPPPNQARSFARALLSCTRTVAAVLPRTS